MRHADGVPIMELLGDDVVWHGGAEMFDLHEHASATRCYGWAYEREGMERRLVVLHAGPTDSRRKAVHVALAHRDRTGTP